MKNINKNKTWFVSVEWVVNAVHVCQSGITLKRKFSSLLFQNKPYCLFLMDVDFKMCLSNHFNHYYLCQGGSVFLFIYLCVLSVC